jgi:cytochrome c peroxidase
MNSWAYCGLALLAAACSGSTASSLETPPEISAEVRAQLAALAPNPLPPPPPDVSNAYADNPRAALFGQKLFFDKGFSGQLLEADNDGNEGTLGVQGQTGRVSCADCHVPSAGFLDNRSDVPVHSVSLAAGWTLRRAPSLLDIGQSGLLMWDGSHDALWNQPFGPLEHANEMNSSRLYAAQQVASRYKEEYESIFIGAPLPDFTDQGHFPHLLTADETGCAQLSSVFSCAGERRGSPGDGAEFDALSDEDKHEVTRVWANAGKALAAYERKLTCGPGRFDAWIQGDATALTPSEQRGAVLFVGKGRCIDCHSGPFFSDEKFHVTGLAPRTVAAVVFDGNDHGALQGLTALMADPLNTSHLATADGFSDGDPGRAPTSVDPALDGAFRTPKLRCVSTRPSFMHTGQLGSLADVVAYFNRGGDVPPNELQPLNLTSQEQQDLVAFLKTLDGPGPDASLLSPP